MMVVIMMRRMMGRRAAESGGHMLRQGVGGGVQRDTVVRHKAKTEVDSWTHLWGDTVCWFHLSLSLCLLQTGGAPPVRSPIVSLVLCVTANFPNESCDWILVT